MKPLIKWPGGKEREIETIRKFSPEYKGRYIEPFLGGGAVFFDIDNKKCIVNDLSHELINFYSCVKTDNLDFKSTIKSLSNEFSFLGGFVNDNQNDILQTYFREMTVPSFLEKYKTQFSSIAEFKNDVFLRELDKNLSRKVKRSQKLELEHGGISHEDRIANIEAAIKSAYYMYVRYLYNMSEHYTPGEQAAFFLFIREYCYSSMFRYNKQGKFNVPYGGISYNKKNFDKKLEYIFSEEVHDKLTKADFYSEDFETFLNKLDLGEDDFIFLDPPYDTEFSTYALNEFDRDSQIRLSEYLKNTSAKFMVVIKNTDFIYSLYSDNFYMYTFDKNYTVSFMNRNNRKTEHLLITNYQI